MTAGRVLIEIQQVYVVATRQTPPRYLIDRQGDLVWGSLDDAMNTFSCDDQRTLGQVYAARMPQDLIPDCGVRITRVSYIPEVVLGDMEP